MITRANTVGILRNRYFLVSDLLLLSVASYAAFVLRLDSAWLRHEWSGCVLFLALTILVTPPIFWRVGIYRRYWPYASVEEIPLLIGATTAAALVIGGIYTVIVPMVTPTLVRPISRSIPAIFYLLAVGAVCGPRLLVRLVASSVGPRGGAPGEHGSTPALIIGAGDAGSLTARELRRNPQLGMHVVGFIDDDSNKIGKRIHGIPVLGGRAALPLMVREHAVRRVIIAMPTAPGRTIREIVDVCKQIGATTQILPGIYELLDGKIHVNQIRSVQIEDLLRRDPIQTDLLAVENLIRGKRVLVTGAGGSIGSELCRQILRFGPSDMFLLGHGENSIFQIHNELLQLSRSMAETNDTPTLHPVIADFRFEHRINAVFDEFRPQIVFHAGAHKHVPLMEFNPSEAVSNNVFGTRNLLQASMATGVERFVLVSTDKAVRPTSVMGATKRVAELLVHQAAEQSGRPFMVTRFGNVLGSRGSVVLTMKQQIAAGGPVTVTHPEMVRYFMTIPEAVQLVLQASVLGTGGEVFTFDMGEPVRILDLAHDLIRLSGLEEGEDIEIAITGVRPGEKLFEELFLPGEKYRRTHHQSVFIAAGASRSVPDELNETIEMLRGCMMRGDDLGTVRTLKAVVPEYTGPEAAAPRGRGTATGRTQFTSPQSRRSPVRLPAVRAVPQGDAGT